MRSERQEAYEPSLLQGAVRGLRRGPFQPGVQVRPRARPHSARGGGVARQSGSNIIDIPIKTYLNISFNFSFQIMFFCGHFKHCCVIDSRKALRYQKIASLYHISTEKNFPSSNYFNSISKEKPPRGKRRFSSNRCSAK